MGENTGQILEMGKLVGMVKVWAHIISEFGCKMENNIKYIFQQIRPIENISI